MSPIPHVVGMVHLLPLPGAPGYAGSIDRVVETAVGDAVSLAEAGFPALMVENFGDVPFYGDTVPPETIAAMTVAVGEVSKATKLPMGVNVLRNDALAAVGVAAATKAAMIRVNVLTGLMYTDQGPLIGKAADVIRLRDRIAPDVEVWADVMVKHAVAPPGADAAQTALETVERGLADAVIVSGTGTGAEPDIDEIRIVRQTVSKETRVVIGSGVTVENLASLLEIADGLIVGSSLKIDGDARERVDASRASRFIETAREIGLL